MLFTNMSGDPDLEFFSDGIAEDMITELSRSRWLIVMARNSSCTYKGQPSAGEWMARELGVRYVLEVAYAVAASACASVCDLLMPRRVIKYGPNGMTGSSLTCSLCRTKSLLPRQLLSTAR